MSDSLADRQIEHGARFPSSSPVPDSFGDPAAELEAALRSCALVDRSDLGSIAADGRDILDLLHRLTTADLRSLEPGRGAPAVLTTPKGRIAARLFVHRMPDAGVLLATGPGEETAVCAHIDRYTFAEDTRLRVDTDASRQFAIVGPGARSALAATGIEMAAPYGASVGALAGVAVRMLGQDGFSGDGVSVVVPADEAAAVWDFLRERIGEAGGRPAGARALEGWRVLRGHPAPGRELTEERNPLEAGLLEAVSFTKGCYVGQEVVARLRTYDKVSRSLVGLIVRGTEAPPAPGSTLFRDSREAGEVTSAVVPAGRVSCVALAFVRREAGAAGARLRVGAADSPVEAEVAPLPFPEVA